MKRFASSVLIISACFYSDKSPTPPKTPEPQPLQQMQCNGDDDRRHTPLDPEPDLRLRNHVLGPLSGTNRTWNGIEVPGHVAHTADTAELFILDEVTGGHLAFYREPYGAGNCGTRGSSNCGYEARFYRKDGTLDWSLRLNDVMSRTDRVEVQDVRYSGGVLYFNEACQSYSSGSNGQCSKLVAVNPKTKRVLWRTKPLVSNSRFVVRGCYIVAGYGFTGEADFLYLVERASGGIVQTFPVSSAPQTYALAGGDKLAVRLYSGMVGQFQMVGFDGAKGQLKDLDQDPAFGGAGYGGAGYGGAAYGKRRMRRGRP